MRGPLQKLTTNSPFPYELYHCRSPKPLPLICVTPLLGRLAFCEDLLLERHLARYFARKGFAALLVKRPIFDFDERQGLEQLETYIQSSVHRNKNVLDHVLQYPEIDSSKVGSFGMSFGGIVNCLWAAQDHRLRVNVFALAGANLPGIFMRSSDPLVRSYLKAVRKSFKGNPKKLEIYLAEILKSEPSIAAPAVKDRQNLMILGLFDRVVHFKYGVLLRKLMGNPPAIFLPAGHYGSVLAAPLLKPIVADFFRKSLKKATR